MDGLRDDAHAGRAASAGGRDSREERRAARRAVGAYHESELGKLLEHVRNGFARYDAGEIDAFDLDDLIHRYHRSTQKLWSFSTGSPAQIARMLDCPSRTRKPRKQAKLRAPDLLDRTQEVAGSSPASSTAEIAHHYWVLCPGRARPLAVNFITPLEYPVGA
jgi:hypothetical protein